MNATAKVVAKLALIFAVSAKTDMAVGWPVASTNNASRLRSSMDICDAANHSQVGPKARIDGNVWVAIHKAIDSVANAIVDPLVGRKAASIGAANGRRIEGDVCGVVRDFQDGPKAAIALAVGSVLVATPKQTNFVAHVSLSPSLGYLRRSKAVSPTLVSMLRPSLATCAVTKSPQIGPKATITGNAQTATKRETSFVVYAKGTTEKPKVAAFRNNAKRSLWYMGRCNAPNVRPIGPKVDFISPASIAIQKGRSFVVTAGIKSIPSTTPASPGSAKEHPFEMGSCAVKRGSQVGPKETIATSASNAS